MLISLPGDCTVDGVARLFDDSAIDWASLAKLECNNIPISALETEAFDPLINLKNLRQGKFLKGGQPFSPQFQSAVFGFKFLDVLAAADIIRQT